MAKYGQTVRLAPYLWAQIDDLSGVFGESKSEVISHIVTDWLSKNQSEINGTKDRLKKLAPQIKELQGKAAKQQAIGDDT